MRISSLVAGAGFGALLHVQVLAADRITDAPFATRSEVIAPHAMAPPASRWRHRSRST